MQKIKGLKKPQAKVKFDKKFIVLALIFSLFALVQGAILNHLLPLMIERGISDKTAVFFMSLIGPMQVVGRLAVGIKFLSTIKLMIACYITALIALCILLFSGSNMVLLYIFITLIGICFGSFYILKPGVTRVLLGDKNFGRINGLLALPYLSMFALSASIASLIWETLNYTALLVILLIVLGFSFLFSVRFEKN